MVSGEFSLLRPSGNIAQQNCEISTLQLLAPNQRQIIANTSSDRSNKDVHKLFVTIESQLKLCLTVFI